MCCIGCDSEVEEEYDEGEYVDDDRPPFDDEVPAGPDEGLLKDLAAAEADDEADDVADDFQPGDESEVEEEYAEDEVDATEINDD